MTTLPRGFDDTEFAARCTHLQAAMAQADVGAVLLTSEAEIRYFTGFMTQFWQSPTRPWFVVIPSSGKPIAIIPSIGMPLMRQCYTENIISWASPAANDDGITLLADVIHKHVGKDGRQADSSEAVCEVHQQLPHQDSCEAGREVNQFLPHHVSVRSAGSRVQEVVGERAAQMLPHGVQV